MMYFTESGYVPEDPIKLNDEFEARRHWDEAIKCLRRGDHYLLVMWDLAGERPSGDSLKLLASSLGVIALAFLGLFIAGKFEPQWKWLQKHIPSPNSHVLFGIFITIVLTGFFFPRRVGNAMGWLLDRTFFRFLGPKEDEKDSE
jgi:hypothetical protein